MQQSITRLSTISFIGGILGRGLTYALTIIVAHTVGARGLGAFAVGLVVLQFSGSVASLGFPTTVQRFLPAHIDNSQRDAITGTIAVAVITPLLVGTFLAVMIFVGVQNIGHALDPMVKSTLRVMVWAIPIFGVFKVSEAATRAYKTTKYAVYIKEVAQPVGAIILVSVAAMYTRNIQWIVGMYVGSLIIAALLGLIYLRRLGAFGRIRTPRIKLLRLFKYSLPVTVTAIAYPMILWSDVLILEVFVDSTEIGQYQAAYRTASLLTFALVSVNSIFPTVAAEYYTNSKYQKLRELFIATTKWIAGFTLYAACYEYIFAEEILGLFGAEFAGAQRLLYILIVGQVVACLVGSSGYLLSMVGHERLEMINTLVMAGINIVLNILLIGKFGTIGAAIATATSIALLNVIRVIEVRLLVKVWPFSREFSRIFPATLVSALIMWEVAQLSLSTILGLVVGGTISSSAFLLMMYLFRSPKDQLLVDAV